MGVNDVSEAVVEVAWAALNTQQEGELKDLLAAEVLENDKLRKSLEVYKKVIEDLELADAVAAASLEEPSSNSASTASSQVPGTPDVCTHGQHPRSSVFQSKGLSDSISLLIMVKIAHIC